MTPAGPAGSRSAGASAVRIAVVLPDLLGTYGDGGNATALAHRLSARDLPVEVVVVGAEERLPASCDVYLLGGSEDGPQRFAAEWLSDGALAEAHDSGAAIVAVCGGLQIIGQDFYGVDGETVPGLGLIPVSTVLPPPGTPRAVGEVVLAPTEGLDVGEIVGFENHRGRTLVDSAAPTLGRCLTGFGNDQLKQQTQRRDGVVGERILATYLHGPVLALNPRLADHVLSWVTGDLPPLVEPEQDARVAASRARRLAPVRAQLGSSTT